MALERILNDISVEAQPRIGPFEGKSALILVCACVVSFILSQILFRIGVDLITTAVACAVPIAGAAIYVLTMINGQAPSHALDTLRLILFEAASWLYLKGFLDRPPLLLKALKPPLHPSLNRPEKGAN
jgi:hypothetical protein